MSNDIHHQGGCPCCQIAGPPPFEPKINPKVETQYHGGGAPDCMSGKQLELPNTEEHIALLNKEVELNEQSGRPYTTYPLHSQLYPVEITELRKQALEGGEDE